MPVDASIYSQVGRQAVQPLNPLEAMANAYQLQNAQIDSDNKRQAMRDDQMSRQAAMQAGGDSSKLYQLLMQGGNIGAAQKVQKQQLEFDKGASEIASRKITDQKTLSEAEALKIGQHADILSQVQTPEQAIMWAKMGLDAGVLKPQQYEMALSNINKLQDPQSFEAWKQQAALGARKFIELNAPKYQNQNLGGTMQTLALPGLGGAPKVVNTSTVTQSPDSIASQETQRRGQNMVDARSREATATALSKPFEVTGPDGTPILVQQDKAGKITPVQGYSPKGAMEKPLPASVVKLVTEARDNAVTIDRLDKSFKPDFAGKGVLGLGADMQLATSGNIGADKDAVEWWKNYRKQAELIERHALFGAALTPTEQGSWRSADIGPGMNADVVKRNLKTRAELSKKIFENATQDQIDAGNSAKRINSLAGRAEFGTSGGNTVQTPDGQVLTFPNKAAADAFKKAAGL